MRPSSASPRRAPAAAGALLCLFGSPGWAQAVTSARLDTVVVTGSRVGQSLDDALPATTLITRADIERTQATHLDELLARTPGVELARTGGPGSQASLFVRGTGSSQVLVLVDGMRLNTALGGSAILGGITVDAIERIEIVRGNLSSLYGSEAIGGVVQIFTLGGAANAARIAVEAGGGDLRAGSASLQQTVGATRFALSAAQRQSRPFSAIDTAQVVPGPFAPGANDDLDASRQRSAALSLEQRVSETATLGATAWLRRNRVDFDSTADGPSATQQETSASDVLQVYGRAQIAPDWELRLQLGQTSDDSVNRSSVPASFNNGAFNARNRQVTLANEVRVAEQASATFGVEQLEQRGASAVYDPAGGAALTAFSRRVLSGWFGVVGRARAQTVQVNLRHDDYSDSGNALTGLVAYGYQWSPAWRVNLQWSNAFRAPSFNDLYFPFFGNPQLSAEKSRANEAGVRFVDGQWRAGLTLYRSRTSDLIAFDAATGRAENIAQASNDGLEATLAWTRGGWRVDAGLSASRPIDEASGERLLRRAPFNAQLAAYYASGAWSLGAEIGRSAARFDSDINTFARTELAGYTLARLVGSWQVARALRLTGRIENLADARYELVDGYNTAGRTLVAGIEARF